MLLPEMIDGLYEDLPDMELLEKDHNSFRQKQRQRRTRRQKQTFKNVPVTMNADPPAPPEIPSPPSPIMPALPVFHAPNLNGYEDKDILLPEVVINRGLTMGTSM